MLRLGSAPGAGVASSAVPIDHLAPSIEDEGIDDFPVDGAHLDALRRARRSRRIAEIHWVDALYRVYMAALIGTVVVVVLAGAVGDTPLTTGQVVDVRTHGPAVIGLIATLALAVGLRSGSRGGPVAVEPGDVRHILLAPVDRGRALRGPALRQVRSGLFAAVLAGGAVGTFADRRLPEPGPAWIAAGAAGTATVVALSLGAAMVASGHRLHRMIATAVGAVLLAWSAADVAGLEVGGTPVPASPGRAVGWLALAPLDLHVAALGALLVAVALVVVGLAGIGGLAIEAAERRTALVGQIRFAATLQDVRTVLVLRRQLAADRPRDRPWFRLGRGPARVPAWRRATNGILRFPASRIARLVLLALVAGAALRGAWAGTAPLVALAGVALWVAGLGPSFVIAVVLGLIAGAVAIVPGAGQVPVAAGLVAGVATAITGTAGALSNVVSGAPSQNDELSLIAPEVAGTRMIMRTAWPPVCAILGALPLLIAEADDHAGRPLFSGAGIAWGVVAGVVVLVVGWVHQRQAIRQWWADAMEAQSTAGRRDEDDDEDEDEDEDDEGADAGPEEATRR